MTNPRDMFNGSESIDDSALLDSYSAGMREIKDLRTKTFGVFYKKYSEKYPDLSTSQITDKLIKMGIAKLNQLSSDEKEMPTFESVDEVYEFVSSLSPTQTKHDVEELVLDMGIWKTSQDEFGVNNAFTFLEKYGGDEYK